MSYFLEIIYEDDDLLVINKPAGLAVHGGNNVKTSLQGELRKKNLPYQLLHRLDRETAGILMLAKTKKSLPKAISLFKQTKKYYWAIVHGKIKKKNFLLEHVLLIDGKKKKLISRVVVLQRFAQFSLLEVELLTGRKHQIRRQCQFIAHPLVGDKIYGDFFFNKQTKTHLMLCAKKMIFFKKNKRHLLTTELPKHFSEFLQKYNVSQK